MAVVAPASAPPRGVRALGPYGCCRGSARAELSSSPPRAPVASRRRKCPRPVPGIVSGALVDETRTQTTISRWSTGARNDSGRQFIGGDPGRGRAAEEGGILARTLMPSHRHRFRARRAQHLILRGGCRRQQGCGAHLQNMLCSLAKAFLRPVLKRTQRNLSFVFFLRSPRTSMVP